MRRGGGFTLIETVMAVAIAAAIWAIAAMALGTAARIGASARELRTAARAAGTIGARVADAAEATPPPDGLDAAVETVSERSADGAVWSAWQLDPVGSPGTARRIVLLHVP